MRCSSFTMADFAVLVGVTLTDVFTVSCPGWRNCYGTPTGLSYSYMAAAKNATPTLPLFRGSNNSVALRLPAGDSSDQFRNKITVVVSDGIGEFQESYIYPVTVSNDGTLTVLYTVSQKKRH